MRKVQVVWLHTVCDKNSSVQNNSIKTCVNCNAAVRVSVGEGEIILAQNGYHLHHLIKIFLNLP